MSSGFGLGLSILNETLESDTGTVGVVILVEALSTLVACAVTVLTV